jgi:uncharacterized protein involved in outer membrane biogenesis
VGFSGKLLRIGLIVVAALVVLVIGAGAVFVATFDPNAQKPRIIAAVKQATGRDLTLSGPLRLGFSLQPTIEARDVALSNPPGFSRPDMMKVDRLDIRLALLPLLSGRVDIGQLVLVHPDVLLETDQQGHTNWLFNPPPAEPPPASTPPEPSTPSAPSSSGSRMTIRVSDVTLTDGVLAYRDDRTGLTQALAIRNLALRAGAATHATVAGTYNGVPVNLVVDAGPLERLQDPAARTPWPIRLRAEAAAATFALDGALTQPALGKGYDASVTANVPDLAPLGPLFAPVKLPPLHDVRFAAHLADKGAPVPAVSGMTLHVGTTDLADRLAGLRLDSLDLTAPAMDQPMKAQLAAQLGTTPVNASGTFGAPNLLLGAGAADKPFPVDVSAQAAGAALTAQGAIAHPRALTGLELHLTADIADLEALGRLLHRDLPPLRALAVRGVLTDANGGLAQGMALNGLNVTSSAGDLEGTVTAGFGMPRSLTADIRSSRLDLDTLKGGAPSNAPPPGSAPPAAAPGQAAPAHPSPASSSRIFSDQPLPFGLLRTVNADVRLAIADLRYDGADTRAIDAHLAVRDGRAALDPFKADLPQGHLEAAVGIDTNQQPTTVALRLQAPGIAVPPLLKALGEPPLLLTGKLEVLADLRGAGDTPHAIASTLDGSLGLSMAGATVDNRVLGSMLGKAVQELNALDLVGKGGTSELRCLAVRLAFQNGIGTFKTLALGSSLATTHGEGSVNLGNETMALRLTPEARVGGTTITIPVRVTGPMRAPSVAVDASAGARDNAGSLAGIIIGGLSGNAKQGGDGCAGPLAIARGQAPPVEAPAGPPAAAKAEAPAPPVSKPPVSKPKPPDPAALLKQLFR